ncbi:MAG: BatA domain-containing protein [Polaribacter sp.]
MQFRNPEVFYFLFLLIIPLLVHLFQLQRFVKVPFTNVAFLKNIQATTRKSSTIKKWIILCTRTLGLLALLVAFSQPYLGNNTSLEKSILNIYLDNSLSVNTSNQNYQNLQTKINKIIENAPVSASYNLITNSDFYENLSYESLKKVLIDVKTDTKTQNIEKILLQNNQNSINKTNTLYKNILLTDFQNIKENMFTNVTGVFYAVKSEKINFSNLSIDSLSITDAQSEYITLTAFIKNQGTEKNNVPLAIYNNQKLLAKQIFSISENSTTPISLSLKKERSLSGKIEITYNDTFSFDNIFYFSLEAPKKTKVLTIGKSDEFLKKIYSEDEFDFKRTSVSTVNYNALLENDLIICNELTVISNSLLNQLKEFNDDGGTLVVIPSMESNFDIEKQLIGLSTIVNQQKSNDTLRISSLNEKHPFFKNVFTDKVDNFTSPYVKETFLLKSGFLSRIVSLENNYPFFSKVYKNGKVYLFSSSLSKENSNFRNSPLVVSLFYTLGQLSFKQPKLYYHINEDQFIDLKVKLEKDKILKVSAGNKTFIPLQKAFQNKVELSFEEQILNSGFHHVLKEKDTITTLAFNNPKSESSSAFMDPKVFDYATNPIKTFDSIEDIFTTIKDFNEVNWLWKWFISLAIVSLLAEILLLKFFKV